MVLNFIKNTVLLLAIPLMTCGNNPKPSEMATTPESTPKEEALVVGANRTETYLPILNGKRVGIVANQTSVIFKNSEHTQYKHLVDSLLNRGINIQKVFAPEHGFRGKADAGEVVKDGIDTKTGLPIVSLYGKNKKPSTEQLSDLDLVVFDIQDVGARFYTYISSLHYVMEACAEQNIPVLILDRPNPNGHYIDGPVLEKEHKSFVGMHPVPVVHGMTIGEYAQMINGQHWLKDGIQCDLQVIQVLHYNHTMPYSLPIKPSPNLPNDRSINLYPSLCFFEGTNVSAGRGTSFQFQIFGSPHLNQEIFDYSFTPQPNEGAKYPKHQGKVCYGRNLTKKTQLNRLDLNYLIEAYHATDNKDTFFNKFFTKLAGTTALQKAIENRYTAREIKKLWLRDLTAYDQMRSAYLLYD